MVEKLSEDKLDELASTGAADDKGVWIEGWFIDIVVVSGTNDVVLETGRTDKVVDWSRWACLLISSRLFLEVW